MIDPQDIHPLTDFNRNAKRHIQRLRRSGEPAVLTVNGKPALVIQDPRAYQHLVGLARRAVEINAIRQGIADVRAGRVRPAKDVFDDLEARYLTKRRGARKSA